MLISQVQVAGGNRVAVRHKAGTRARLVRTVTSVLDLAQEAIKAGCGLAEMIHRHGADEAVNLDTAYAERRILSPITHADPAHLLVTGTGLTHLGSAATRDSMHAVADTEMTDSMKMFRMGLEDGKPAKGKVGVQPEWFYKGNGTTTVAPGAALTMPAFADDGGEEPEIAGVYVIGPDGTPFRLGFALSNEFSDHVMERVNYLYLAHSKLREASLGPEILVGELPDDVRGMSRILRNGTVLWEKPFLSGEANMSHTIANLEHHHFKYGLFCQPGDVHVHCFGTATLSFADKVKTEVGDVFEIESLTFGLPLRNGLARAAAEQVEVVAL